MKPIKQQNLISKSYKLIAENFEPFLRSYINNFKNKSLTTQQWKNYLYEFFQNEVSFIIYFNLY